MADIARLAEVIDPVAKALGFDLVRVKMIGSDAGDGERGLQIMAEDPATGQLLIEQCAELSRAISDRMDELEEAGDTLVEGAYRLEVSSPGIDRPLTRTKDFADWAGHEVRVSLTDGIESGDGKVRKTFKGILAGITDEVVTVEDFKAKTSKFPFANIHSAKLVLTDKLIAATRPLDTSGADDIIEEQED
ncbi:ribosome maturation protein RimP [Altererythrobacter sp. ZODW24]|uniref:ribosome maturation protein RimP n=1 Tax=Altererythrobacter sp. ZODW24 TaxID=2185142 RepID=UPI000DF85255|nr:ribosome maturation protein RimP [Altererythrobacter sp. ZODW24]